MLIYEFKGEEGLIRRQMEHMSSRPFVLTDTAESRGQKGDLCSLEARGEAACKKALCAPPPTTMCRETKSGASATDCCFVSTFFFSRRENRPNSLLLLLSPLAIFITPVC